MSRNVPGIPEPARNIDSIYAAIVAIKEGLETLLGHRGPKVTSAVTFQDLIDMELIQEDQIPSD